MTVGVRVVLTERGHAAVALDLIAVGTQTSHPLDTISREAEEVWSRIAQRCVLGSRRAVDDRLIGNCLGVVAERQPFVPRERSDDAVDFVLLDELPSLLASDLWCGIGALFDKTDLLASDGSAKLGHGELDTTNSLLTVQCEGPFQRREDADDDLTGSWPNRDRRASRCGWCRWWGSR